MMWPLPAEHSIRSISTTREHDRWDSPNAAVWAINKSRPSSAHHPAPRLRAVTEAQKQDGGGPRLRKDRRRYEPDRPSRRRVGAISPILTTTWAWSPKRPRNRVATGVPSSFPPSPSPQPSSSGLEKQPVWSLARADWGSAAIDPRVAPGTFWEYLQAFGDAAFGAVSSLETRFASHADPASKWMAAQKGTVYSPTPTITSSTPTTPSSGAWRRRGPIRKRRSAPRAPCLIVSSSGLG